MKRIVLPVLLAAGLLAACETVVEVKLPPHEARLVAHSLFEPDSLWRVHVSTTIASTGLQDPHFVDEATVEIWDGGLLVERLLPIGQGTFTSATNKPAPEKTYSLRVTAPGFGVSEGAGAVPPAAHVTDFEQQLVDEIKGETFVRRTERIELTVEDPADARNYYGLQVLQDRRLINNATGEIILLPRNSLSFASNDPALGDPDVFNEKTSYNEAVFNDDLFDGRSYTFDFEIEYTIDLRERDVKIERSFEVVFRAMSEDYFRYWKTVELQNDVGDNPFAEPVRVHSNMTGGFGIFAGYRTEVFPLEIRAY